MRRTRADLRPVGTLISFYVAVTVATIAVLAALSATHSGHAGDDAWGHAVLVGVFAVLMPLRYAAARRGSVAGRRALVIIPVVLAVVNVVEALIPGLFPGWMRVEMAGIAALMFVTAACAVRTIRS